LAHKKKAFDIGTEVKAIARERVGSIPASKPMPPKSTRKKPKYKKPPGEEDA
jgi:hypothetical protein